MDSCISGKKLENFKVLVVVNTTQKRSFIPFMFVCTKPPTDPFPLPYIHRNECSENEKVNRGYPLMVYVQCIRSTLVQCSYLHVNTTLNIQTCDCKFLRCLKSDNLAVLNKTAMFGVIFSIKRNEILC